MNTQDGRCPVCFSTIQYRSDPNEASICSVCGFSIIFSEHYEIASNKQTKHNTASTNQYKTEAMSLEEIEHLFKEHRVGKETTIHTIDSNNIQCQNCQTYYDSKESVCPWCGVDKKSILHNYDTTNNEAKNISSDKKYASKTPFVNEFHIDKFCHREIVFMWNEFVIKIVESMGTEKFNFKPFSVSIFIENNLIYQQNSYFQLFSKSFLYNSRYMTV